MDAALLNAALSGDATAGESLLAAAAQPGFCACALAATEPSSGLSDDARLLAATLLKNEVLRHWRSGTEATERPALRAALMQRLTSPEPCERVGAQLALAVARVMRHETNSGEAAVLEAFDCTLRAAALPGHALLALLYTAKELATMRLPTQRRLAARVGHVLLRSVGPLWEAAVCGAVSGTSSCEGGALGGGAVRGGLLGAAGVPSDPSVTVHAALLYSKVLRRLLALAHPEGSDGAPVDGSSWHPMTACGVALEAVRELQRRSLGEMAAATRASWSRLGGSLAKLIGALLGALGAEHAATARPPMLLGGVQLLVGEAAVRQELRRAAGGTATATLPPIGGEGGDGGGGAAVAPLDLLHDRERFSSPLAVHLALMLEQLVQSDAEWVHAAIGALRPLVEALVSLTARTVGEMRRWAADPEAFACEVLLSMDDAAAEDEAEADADGYAGNAVDDGAGAGVWREEEEEGAPPGSDDDGADGGARAALSLDGKFSAGGAGERLRRAAEQCLSALLCSLPDEVGAALLALMPHSACAADDSLAGQLYREACYGALGLGAWQLQWSLSYAQLLGAIQSEMVALLAASQGVIAMGAALQARLCWLVSCWWAFGGSGDDAQDALHCAATYEVLCQVLLRAPDLAVQLQAAHVIRTLVGVAGDDDLRIFAPHAPLALVGLAATLASCATDEGCLGVLRAMRTLLQLVPEAAHSSGVREAALPVLTALWQRAEAERRPMLTAMLRRVAGFIAPA